MQDVNARAVEVRGAGVTLDGPLRATMVFTLPRPLRQ